MTTKYNPENTTVTWGGLNFGNGLAADSSITITPSADVVSYSAGLKRGEGVKTQMTDTSAEITLSTQYGSDLDKKLAALYDKSRLFNKDIEATMTIKNRADAISHVLKGASLSKRPTINYSADAANMGNTWTFIATNWETSAAGDSSSRIISTTTAVIDTLLNI